MISVVVGLVLAVAYHLLAMRFQRWAFGKKFIMTPIITVLGFIVRMAVLVVILVVLGLWSPLNILALCLSFVVVFTILNGIWLYRLMISRHRVPPSAGATGAS